MTSSEEPHAVHDAVRITPGTADDARRPDDDGVSVPVPAAVRGAASWSWRVIVIAAAVALLVWLLAVLEVIVVPVVIALLITVLMSPVVHVLQRRLHFSRTLAAATTVIGLIVAVVGLLTAAGTSVASGISDLWDEASQGIDKVTDWLSTGPLQLSGTDITNYVDQARSAVSGSGSSIASGALAVTVTVGHVAAGTLIAIFCTFFFLLDGRRIWNWLVGLLPRNAREPIHQAGRRGLVTLGAYTRTQILVAAVDSLGIGIGAVVLRLPLAFPLAILVFLGSFIPIVGAVLTGSVAVLVALVTHGPVSALIMLAVVLLVQQIEGHVLQPFLMGHAVSLHPVAVLLSVAAGSLVGGIVGALFAVPLAATVNTVVLYLHGHDKFPQLGADDHVPIRETHHVVLDRSIAEVQDPSDAEGIDEGTASGDDRPRV